MKKITSVLTGMIGFGCGAVVVGRLAGNSAKCWKKMSDKHLALMLLFNQWMINKQSGKDIKEYFVKKKYQKIIIYGMSYVGERLLDELKRSDIEIVAAVDKNADSIFADISVISPDDKMPEAECVVVTPVYFFEEIAEEMSAKVTCPIISLEDILYEI